MRHLMPIIVHLPLEYSEPRLCKENNHILTSKSSGSSNSTYIPSSSVSTESVPHGTDSVHWGINPSVLFCQVLPPLNLQTVQACLYRQFPPTNWFFEPINPIPSFESN